MKGHWSAEKEVIGEIQLIKEKIEGYKTSEQNAQREGDLAKAAEIRYGTLVTLDNDLKDKNREA